MLRVAGFAFGVKLAIYAGREPSVALTVADDGAKCECGCGEFAQPGARHASERHARRSKRSVIAPVPLPAGDVGTLCAMSESDAHRVWVVKATVYGLDGFFSYHGALPEPGDIIDVTPDMGETLSLRVSHVDPDGQDHQIRASEINLAPA